MSERAIEKLKTEMDQNKDNAYIQVIGEYLIKFTNKNKDLAEKFLVETKTIGQSLKEMKTKASKKKKDGFAMFTLEEGLEIVLNYFEITTKAEVEKQEVVIPIGRAMTDKEMEVEAIVRPKEEKKNTVNFDIRLEDLL